MTAQNALSEHFPIFSGKLELGLVLGDSDIDVWSAHVDIDPRMCERFEAMLSDAERGRARRLRFDSHRRRFVASHAFMRSVLAAYCGGRPEALQFDIGGKGKPRLADGPEFNLSHAGALALVAVGGMRAVGVDIEEVRPIEDAEPMAARFFCRAERDALQRLAPGERALGFLLCWTRKEAYIKAIGEGLSAPLDQFEVSCAPGEPPSLAIHETHVQSADAWSLHHLAPAPGYVGALVASGTDVRVRTRHLCLDSAFGT